jgi:hypothetical protein
MSEVSGAADQPLGRARGFPSAPPPLSAAADITGWRSWWGAVTGLARQTWRPGGRLLLAWAVLPALPTAGIIAVVAVAFEGAAGRTPLLGRTFPWEVLLIPAVLLVPFVIAGGYLVARAWTGAAWVTALRAAGLSDDQYGVMSRARRPGLLWMAYLIGVAVLCLVAAIVGGLMTNDMLVRTILTSVGPLGLLAPLILLAPGQLYADHPRTGGQAQAGQAQAGHAQAGQAPDRRQAGRRLTGLVIAVLAYQIAVGAALSPLVNAARVLGVLGVLIAFILSIPATLLLAAAGHITYAPRRNPPA